MSAVRMCDKCGTIFSENADGWSTGQATRMVRDEKNRRQAIGENIDICPMCTNGTHEVQPRLLTAGAADRIADTLVDGDVAA